MSEVWYSIAPDGDHNYTSYEFPSTVTGLQLDDEGNLVVLTDTGVSVIKERPT